MKCENRRLRLERLESREMLAGDTFLVNFQLAGSPEPTRYAPDTGEIYGARGGGLFYGWSSDHTDVSRDREVNPDQRLDTLIHFHQGQNWELAVPNGLYEVTVSIGDAGFGSTHTLNVEGTNYWNVVPLAPGDFRIDTQQVLVTDGRLTLDQGTAAEKATRINYLQAVGLPTGPNAAPSTPIVTEPSVDGQIVNPTDVHMEAVGFFDTDGDLHKSSDWEIWAVGDSGQIYSDVADGFVEFRNDGSGNWPQVHPDSSGGFAANVGEWFGDIGLTSIVLPFQLPDFGAVTDPFLTVDLGVHMFEKGTATVTNADLYAVRTDASPALLVSDYYSGATIDPSATLIQEDFFTPSTPIGIAVEPNVFTNAAGDAALLSYLNSAYAGGAGAGDYVFLRLSYASDSYPSGWDAYKITTSEAGGGVGDYPVLSYTASTGSPERIWQTLGITGVERLHTHLADGVFENSHAGFTELLGETNYEVRVRFRDDAGSVSGYDTRAFTTAPSSQIFPLEIEDVRTTPTPTWRDSSDDNVIFPQAGPNQSMLEMQSAGGDLLLSIAGNDGVSNTVVNPATLSDHADVRIVITAGSAGLNLGETDLVFVDDQGLERTVFLPAISLSANQRLDLWVAADGATYFGTSSQTEPDFSNLARQVTLPIPFIVQEAGYEIDVVADGLQLPVNIAFVPNPGSNPGDPLFYVNELYGTIKVVTNDFTMSDYATGLLNFNPTGNFPGSGEQGLAGIVVDPATGDVIVTRVTDTDGIEGGAHHPQVVRLSSSDGGLTSDSQTVLLDMVGESQGQSHQISNISIGPDGKLYVHNGDGFDASTAQNLDSYRGKILRMNLDGTAPTDNIFYNAGNGINSRDYIYAYGFRNPFGGAWRDADGKLYEVENGPSIDRLAQVNQGVDYGWAGANGDMFINANYNWVPSHAPVNIAFVQSSNFNGSGFPSSQQDIAFVSESGPTYAQGTQTLGKRIVGFDLDASGNVVSGPTSFVEYVGTGRATVVGLSAGPDGLYFTDLYKDLDAASPIEAGAKVYRVRYTAAADADFDGNGRTDALDFLAWQRGAGTTSGAVKSDGDSDNDGDVDADDLAVWESDYPGTASVANVSTPAAIEISEPDTSSAITSSSESRVSSEPIRLSAVVLATTLQDQSSVATEDEVKSAEPMLDYLKPAISPSVNNEATQAVYARNSLGLSDSADEYSFESEPLTEDVLDEAILRFLE